MTVVTTAFSLKEHRSLNQTMPNIIYNTKIPFLKTTFLGLTHEGDNKDDFSNRIF
jgi:hypothetical protein